MGDETREHQAAAPDVALDKEWVGSTRSYAWERRDLTGLGMVTIAESTDGQLIHGAEVACDDDGPWSVRFDLDVDDSWTTVSMEMKVVRDGETKRILLERAPDATWRAEGVPAADLEGCTDVDITSTPFTNTRSRSDVSICPSQTTSALQCGPGRRRSRA